MTAQESNEADEAWMIGLIVGAMGATAANAAMVRHALQCFETQHRRKATPQDFAIVASMIRVLD
jgi:hypothetical protein